MDKIIDWTKFYMRIHIHKSKSIVYDAWTQKSKIEEWFLELANYKDNRGINREPLERFMTGDTFEWKWNNWDIIERGEILEANPEGLVSFTFGSGGFVSVELKEMEGGTEIKLTQEQIPLDEESRKNLYVGCSNGWTFWLANLKAWLEHDITLHAKGLTKEQAIYRVNS